MMRTLEVRRCLVCETGGVEHGALHAEWCKHKSRLCRLRYPVMTYRLAMAAGFDAGNRSMKKAGRSVWNELDVDAAAAEFQRLYGKDII